MLPTTGIPFIGRILLLLALFAAVYNIGATAYAYKVQERTRPVLLASAHNAALAVWALLTAAFGTLIYLFLANDFSVTYVTGHSSIEQQIAFKISGVWGGQEGSLLLWAWVLGAYAVAVAVFSKRAKLEIGPTAVSVVTVVSVFFIGLISFAANPFTVTAGEVPTNGRGLNPLLQNYWMQIHPPTLYFGYVGCTVPFAFAMAALLHRRFDSDWVGVVRRWTLFPWLVLTLGIIMGGAWAYETLGWGGYWAWDPVENASLMPWLVGTAFLHSIMIQAKRGMLKTWNVTLVTLMFLLSVFGTFLTRSGVVSSVHSFAESNIGGYFLGFLALALVASFALIIWRRDDLTSEIQFESPISREGAFLLNNWILLGACFAVLWGTVFPSVSEALSGQTISVGAPYFNRVMIPLGLVLLFLTGVGPLMAWRRASPRALIRTFRMPILVAILATPLLLWLSAWHTGAATSFCLCVFVAMAIGSEFVRGARARHSMTGEPLPVGFVNLLMKNKQRYGGYIVHLGVVILYIGITGSSVFQIENEPITLKPGETMKVGEYTLRYDGLFKPAVLPKEKEQEVAAGMTVMRDGKALVGRDGQPVQMRPSVDFFKAPGAGDPEARAGQPPQQARRPAIMTNWAHDLYLALIAYDPETNTATIKSYLNPLVRWVWVSNIFFLLGTMIAILPDKRRQRVRKEAEETFAASSPGGFAPTSPATTRPQVIAATTPRTGNSPRNEAR